MFAKRTLAIATILAAVIGLAVPARAEVEKKPQSLLIQRVDWTPYCKASPMTAVITPHIELWAYGWANDNLFDLEVGKMWPLDPEGQLSVGAYLVSWPDYGKTFILPWFTFKGEVGPGELHLELGLYKPLNGGPRILNGNEIAYMVPFDRDAPANASWEVGLTASFLQVDDNPAPVSFGPKIRFARAFEASWQPLSFSGAADHRFRLQAAIPF